MTAENRAAIRNLPPLLGARFIDVGICEQTMIGTAAGLALRGRIPIVHALADLPHAARVRVHPHRRRHRPLPVKLVGGVPGFLSDANGPTHQAIEDVALMRGIPGMQVFCPADDARARGRAARPSSRARAPGYVRYNAGAAVVAHEPFALGRAEVLCRRATTSRS